MSKMPKVIQKNDEEVVLIDMPTSISALNWLMAIAHQAKLAGQLTTAEALYLHGLAFFAKERLGDVLATLDDLEAEMEAASAERAH